MSRTAAWTIGLAVMALATAGTAAPPGTARAASARKAELVQLAQRRFQAFYAGDKAAYAQIVARDAVFTYSNGRTLNYAQALSELAPLAPPGTYGFRYQDIQLRDFGDSALLVYRLIFHGPPDGGGDYQGTESDTFARRDGTWKLVAVHGTTIPYSQRTNVSVAPSVLDAYVGRYQRSPGVFYDVTRQGDQLYGQRAGFQKTAWLAESKDVFYAPGDPTAVRVFMRDATGAVAKLMRIDIQGDTEWIRLRTAPSQGESGRGGQD